MQRKKNIFSNTLREYFFYVVLDKYSLQTKSEVEPKNNFVYSNIIAPVSRLFSSRTSK